MATTFTVSSLSESFKPSGPTRGTPVAFSSKHLGAQPVATKVEAPVFYVEPTLRLEQQRETENPICYLISAPAAVGKTTLAHYMHGTVSKRSSVVLYVPLKDATIGDHFFTGLLTGAFPDASRNEIMDQLFSGAITIFFDGYDEVSMTSAQVELNRKFSQEISRALEDFKQRGGKPAPCIVFLFRSVFFELGIFDPLMPFSQHLAVEFFSPSQRRAYLSAYLHHKAPEQHLNHLVATFLDAFESRLATASAEADAFFGHAIVLSAFGDFLLEQDEANALRLAHELSQEGIDERASTAILGKIIAAIVTREVGKFPGDPWASKLSGFVGYSVSVQERLLRALAHDNAVGADGPQLLPGVMDDVVFELLTSHPSFGTLIQEDQDRLLAALGEEYRRRVSLHPFVDVKSDGRQVFRNPIYNDYYLAQYAAHSPQADVGTLLSGEQRPSFYLAIFFLASIANRDLASHPAMHFYVLQLLSASCNGDEYEARLTFDSTTRRWSGRVASKNLRMNDYFVTGELLFLEFPPSAVLQNFVIDGGSDGIVGFRGPSGSDFREETTIRAGSIEASEFELDAAHVALEGLVLNVQTLRLSERMARLNGLQTLTLHRREPFEFTASPFAVERWQGAIDAASAADASELHSFTQKIEKMFLWFRKHKRGEYATYLTHLHRVVLGKGRDVLGSRIAEFLFEEGVFYKDEPLVVLAQPKLDQYGIYYRKQNELNFGPRVSELFARWRTWASQHP